VFVANPEDYGALFQWGRKGDGHEQRTSAIHSGTVGGSSNFDANGQIISWYPAYGKFITITTSSFPPSLDWRSPQIDNLWNSGTESSPIKTANDPCPAGWRIPTSEELQSLVGYECEWDALKKGRYFCDGTNRVFFPAAGARSSINGNVSLTGENGYYCSSFDAHAMFVNSGYDVGMTCYQRAVGFSVRCVAE